MRSGVDTIWCPPRSKWTRSQMSEAVENLGSGRGPGALRRRWSDAEKRRIVAESYQPGVSVSVVARRNDVNANLVFNWRRRFREQAGGTGGLVPVVVEPPPLDAAAGDAPAAGRMEIALADGASSGFSTSWSCSSTSLRRAQPRTGWRPNRRRRGPRRSRGLRAASRSRRTCRASAWWCRRRLPARAADWRSCRRSART